MKKLLAKIRKILHDRRTRRFLTRFVSGVAALIVFVTTYALVLPAITMEKEAGCGIEAHQHDDSCYTEELICDIPERDGHHHDESCYSTTSTLVCETEEHEHSVENGCYDDEGNLICEVMEHRHNEECYEEVRELTCQIPESEGHHHTEDCYEKVLTCGKEVHVHSTACYENDPVSDAAVAASTSSAAASTASAGSVSSAGMTLNFEGDIEKIIDTDEPADDDSVDNIGSDETNRSSETNGTSEIASSDKTNTEAASDTEVTYGRENAGTGHTETSNTALTNSDNSTTALTSSADTDQYIPQLDAVDFNTVLNNHTGIYYYRAADEDIVEDSSAIPAEDWNRIPNNTDNTDLMENMDDVELGGNDLLRVYLSYTIPAGSLNATNPVARYRLPSNLHLTDSQVKAINENVNGLAGQYVDLSTLEITDPDMYNAYLGVEAVEGTRRPDEAVEDYLAEQARKAGTDPDDAAEYISAAARVENVYDADGIYGEKDAYLGQDLIFTFAPYSIEKNQHEYDSKGQPTKAGQEIKGWLTLDLNIGQVDFGEAEITTSTVDVTEAEDVDGLIEDDRNEDERTEDGHIEDDRIEDDHTEDSRNEDGRIEDEDASEGQTEDEHNANDNNAENSVEDKENNPAGESGEDTENPQNNTVTIERSERTAEIVFVEEGWDQKDNKIDQISTRVTVVEKTVIQTQDNDTEENSEEAAAENSEEPGEGSTEESAAGNDADQSDKGDTDQVIMPAMSFTDSIRVSTGKPAGIDEDVEGTLGSAVRSLPQEAEVSVRVEADEGTFPAGTTMLLKAVEDLDAVAEAVTETVENSDPSVSADGADHQSEQTEDSKNNNGTEEKKNLKTYGFQAVDITFLDKDGKEIQPAKPVRVAMTSEIAEQVKEEAKTGAVPDPVVVHVDDDGNAEQMELVTPEEIEPAQGKTEGELLEEDQTSNGEQEETGTTDAAGETPSVGFTADSFSVYVIVYTVDFHWEVDGKMYEFSIPGGGFVSFTQLVEALGIAKQDVEGNFNEEEAATLTLDDIEVSDQTREFVADVEKVEFSDTELLSISKIEENTTVGAIKDSLGLECVYSTELTEEQIAGINASEITSGDWALISLKPFLSNECLTVTMKNGEVFSVNVTDGQLHTLMLSNSGDIYSVTVTYDDTALIPDDAELRVRQITEDEDEYDAMRADVYEKLDSLKDSFARPVLLDISIVSNGEEIEPAEGSEVKVEVKLVREAMKGVFTDDNSPLLINDKPMQAENGFVDQQLKVLHYTQSGDVEVMDTTDKLADDEVASSFVTDSFSDWLLFLDEDANEITIGLNDTLTLRPYTEWVWKKTEEEGAFTTAKWAFPDTQWTITGDWTSNSGTGTATDVNGIMTFTRKSKYDDQIKERYDVLHGTANQIGTTTLQIVNDNGVIKTISVNVVQDVNDVPNTIQNAADLKVNLYDYDINPNDPTKSGVLDNVNNTANNNATYSWYNDTINAYSDLKFLGWGGGNTSNDWFEINNYSNDVANPGILRPLLDGGYPVLAPPVDHPDWSRGTNTSLKYLFDKTTNDNAVVAHKNVNGLFQKDSNGYYYYNSNSNYAYYDGANDKVILYEHTYSQHTTGSDGVNAKPIGFFPFHEYDASFATTDMNFNTTLNHHFGMDMAVNFQIPDDGLDYNGNPITFEFSGDDDMWVFIDDVLVMDVGGIHQPVTGSINFSANRVKVYGQDESTISQQFTNAGKTWRTGDGVPHTMKVFYLERGGCDSNLSLRFNLPTSFGKGKLKLKKRDSSNNAVLKNATFKIWNNEQCVGDPIRTATTDDRGEIEFSDFLLDSATDYYYMQETAAPDGYIRDTRTFTIKPKVDGSGNPIKDSNNEYVLLDVYDPDGNLVTVLNNGAIDFPNTKIPKIDIPAKKEWTNGATSTAVVTLTVKRYKLIDVTQGFKIIKELVNEPKDSGFAATYTITYPDDPVTYPNGKVKTIQYSDFEDGVYSLLDDPDPVIPGTYTITEEITSDEPAGYHMSSTPEPDIETRKSTQTVTLVEDGTASATFRTTYTPIQGTLTIKAELNKNGANVNYNNVRYVILDENGRKVTSAPYSQVSSAQGKKFELPVGKYSVKIVNIPTKPTNYIEQQGINYNDSTQLGTIRNDIVVEENEDSRVTVTSSYYRNGVTNHWEIQDMYLNGYGVRPVYKGGDIEFPAGTKVEMSFTADRDTVYTGFNNGPEVYYNGTQLTTFEVGFDNSQNLLFRVEFVVQANGTLEYRVNADKNKNQNFSDPVFRILEEAHLNSSNPGRQMTKSLRAANGNNLLGAANDGTIDISNTAARPDPPAGKKYIADPGYEKTLELKSGNNWQDVLEQQPATDVEGNKYYYYIDSVSEVGLEPATSCTILLDGGKKLLIGQDLNPTGTLKVSNTVERTGSLIITKKVTVNGAEVDNTAVSPADGTYTFKLTKKNDTGFAVRTFELTIVNGKAESTDEISGLEPGTYVVEEVRPSNGTEISKVNEESTTSYSHEVEIEAGQVRENAVEIAFTNNIGQANIKIVKVIKGTQMPLAGAKFTLTRVDEDGRVITDENLAYTSGEKSVDETTGEVQFEGILSGRYRLEESKVPDGYIMKEGPYFIVVNGNGTSGLDMDETIAHEMITPDAQNSNTYYVENEPGAALPHTGGPGTSLFYLLGIMLTCFSGGGIVMRRKRRTA